MRVADSFLCRSTARLLLGFTTLVPMIAAAGAGTWTSGGPYGGFVGALAIARSTPTTQYAATADGVFRSTDSGDSWSNVGPELDAGPLGTLAVDPSNAATVYVGTSRGLFKSTDSGASWAPPSSELSSDSVYALVIDPATPSTLYIGTFSGKVSKSTDGGATWKPARAGLTLAVYALALDPSTPSTLYAGTDRDGAFKSTDSGGSWINIGPDREYPGPQFLAVDPQHPTTIYAGTDGRGVFRSTDSGSTWSAASSGLPSLRVSALAPDPKVPGAVYVGTFDDGVFRSSDSGATWRPVNAGLPSPTISSLAIHPSAPGVLFAGTSFDGVFESVDSGATWRAASRGLAARTVQTLAIDPLAPDTLYAGTQDRAFKSSDGGRTWTAAGLTNRDVRTLAIDPLTPATLYAGTYYYGVFKSTDSGGTWVGPALPLVDSTVSSLAIDPKHPSTLYSAGFGVSKSSDSGATWAKTSLAGGVSQLAIDPTTPSTLYAGTDTGVFKSTDSGGSWAPVGTGLPESTIRALVIDPAATSTIYAASFTSVFKSTDSGGSWAPSATGLTDVSILALAVSRTSSDTLYAGTNRGSIYRPENHGVFRSTDSGATWSPFNLGLNTPEVRALGLDPRGTTVYAGGSGVWQITLASGRIALLPSSARAAGAGGAFYTTDLTVANTGSTASTFAVKFLGHDADGTSGLEQSFAIGSGESRTFADVLGSVFGLTSDYGAIRVTSPSDAVRVTSQTSTRAFGGTFGQSVPAAREEDLIVAGTPRLILAVREDASFRTNVIFANATDAPLDVDAALVAQVGVQPLISTKRFRLPPAGMTQVSRVVRELGVSGPVSEAYLALSTPTEGGRFAAYASAIDNVTNDPRTLLPQGPIASAKPSPDRWIVPSSARASGAGGAFYTTDLTVAFPGGTVSAEYTLKFLGHDADGRNGQGSTFFLTTNRSATYADVLGSVFQRTSDYGAIQVESRDTGIDGRVISVAAQTSTRGFGGTFGQSVPAATAADLIRFGAPRSILAVREDDAFRTNLILANATDAPLDVDAQLVLASGAAVASKRYRLAPLGMTQITKVVRDLGIQEGVAGARVVLSTPVPSGSFAAYAAVIDNVTNDPRTLLPR